MFCFFSSLDPCTGDTNSFPSYPRSYEAFTLGYLAASGVPLLACCTCCSRRGVGRACVRASQPRVSAITVAPGPERYEVLGRASGETGELFPQQAEVPSLATNRTPVLVNDVKDRPRRALCRALRARCSCCSFV